MADYNIYIHSATTPGTASFTSAWDGSQNSPTQIWQQNGTSADSQSANSTRFSLPSFSAIKNVGKFASGHPGLSVIAVAKAIMVATEKVSDIIGKISDIRAEGTGDYSTNVKIHNFTATMHILNNPFQSAFSYWRATRTANIHNRKYEQERMLIGESYVNSSKRGV